MRGELSHLETYIQSKRLEQDKDLANEIRNNFVVRNSSENIDMADIFNQLR